MNDCIDEINPRSKSSNHYGLPLLYHGQRESTTGAYLQHDTITAPHPCDLPQSWILHLHRFQPSFRSVPFLAPFYKKKNGSFSTNVTDEIYPKDPNQGLTCATHNQHRTTLCSLLHAPTSFQAAKHALPYRYLVHAGIWGGGGHLIIDDSIFSPGYKQTADRWRLHLLVPSLFYLVFSATQSPSPQLLVVVVVQYFTSRSINHTVILFGCLPRLLTSLSVTKYSLG